MNINKNFVIFDIETTGLDVNDSQIIEIGAIKLDENGKEIDRFHKFINLFILEAIPEKIEQLTNITTQLLKDEGENIDSVMKKFHEFFNGSILVAQNSKFDLSFLDNYYIKEQKKLLTNIVVDTIDLAKNMYPNEDKYDLASILNYFNIEYEKEAHHRADYDAFVTSEIFKKVLNHYEKINLSLNEIKNIIKLEPATEKQLNYLGNLLSKKGIIIDENIKLYKRNIMRQIDLLR